MSPGVRARTPETPAMRRSQLSAAPQPRGVTSPMPVTTTRRKGGQGTGGPQSEALLLPLPVLLVLLVLLWKEAGGAAAGLREAASPDRGQGQGEFGSGNLKRRSRLGEGAGITPPRSGLGQCKYTITYLNR